MLAVISLSFAYMMLDIVIELFLVMFKCVEKFLVGQSNVLTVGILDEQGDVQTMIVGLFFVVLNDDMIGSGEEGDLRTKIRVVVRQT